MKDKCFGNYFIITALLVFFMLLYIYVGIPTSIQIAQRNIENYKDSVNELIPLDNIMVIQGNGVPDISDGTITFDQNDPSASSVDGTPNSPKSLFAFAYNKCDINCCEGSPYSCNGGCVCFTPEQKKYLSNRGQNNKFDKCSFDEY